MLRLRTLGECAIESDASRIGPDADVLFAIGLYLAMERGRRVARAELLELIWPSVDGLHGRHCLRQALYRLRQSGAVLDSTTTHVMLAASEVELDFADFLSSAPFERALPDDDRCREFLPGYAPDFSAPFGEWVEEQRAFVHGQIRRALVTRLGELRARGDWARVEGVARTCLRFDPLNEEATLARAEAAAMTGSKREAVAILDRYLAELGPGATEIRLPASLLKKRIGEHLPTARFTGPSETPFVGRAAEMALLQERIAKARQGEGGAFTVVGDAGIGKTRLLDEATAAAALQGIRTQRFTCRQHDIRRPLGMFVDLVPALRALPGAIGCSPESLALLTRLTELESEPTPSEADTNGRRTLASRIRQALFDLLDAVSEERCVVVVVDDVQWLDTASWDVLEAMIDWSSRRKLLFVLSGRTEAGSAPAIPPTLHAELALHPLAEGSARDLVLSLIRSHGRELDEDFMSWCIGVAERNPFFLRELTLHWIATGRADSVPVTVQSVVDSRISAIGDHALRMLQACAILGKLSTFARLQQLLEYPAHEALDGLEQLEGRGLVLAASSRVECRHQLVTEAVLRRMLPAAKRFLHRAAAQLLERELLRAPSTSVLWDCARHWRDAGEDGEALRVAASCARHLLAIGLPGDADEILNKMVEMNLSHEQQCEIEQMRIDACRLNGRWERAMEVREAISALRGSQESVSPVHTDDEIIGLEAAWLSETEQAGLLDRLSECATSELASKAHRLRAAGIAMAMADHACDAKVATRIYRIAAATVAETPDDQLAQLRVELIYHSSYGDLRRAVEKGTSLLALHRIHGNPALLCRVLGWTAVPLRRWGDFPAAKKNLLEALEISKERHLDYFACLICVQLAALCYESSDLTDARRWRDAAIVFSNRAPTNFAHVGLQMSSGHLALAEGSYEGARDAIRTVPYHGRRDLRIEAEVLAIQTQAAMLARDEEELQRLIVPCEKLFARLRATGDQDFFTLAFVNALCSLGRQSESNEALSSYLQNYRRERAPVPAWFKAPVEWPDSVYA